MSQIFFAALEVVVHVFDIVAFPISWIVWRPWARIKAREEYRSKVDPATIKLLAFMLVNTTLFEVTSSH